MKVFVSWSGELSKRIAAVLRQYLPVMLQGLEVFMSKHDLESGSRWSAQLAKELEDSDFGIICLSPDNLTSSWLLFESGALTKHIDGRACGLLIGDLKPTDVTGPLAQFQHRHFLKEDMALLLRDINAKLSKPLEATQVQMIFEKWWSDIEGQYQEALKNSASERTSVPSLPRRDQHSLIEEMLDRIRSIERTLEGQTIPTAPRLVLRTRQGIMRRLKDELAKGQPPISESQKQLLIDIYQAYANGRPIAPSDYIRMDVNDLNTLVTLDLINAIEDPAGVDRLIPGSWFK